MIFLVAFELIPESLERCTGAQTAWSLMTGLISIRWFTAWLAI